MKHFHFTLWSLLTLFFLIMGVVVTTAYLNPSHQTGVDPARLCEMRKKNLPASISR